MVQGHDDEATECQPHNSLWGMPLNTGWVPVKSCRLQNWQKLKKYVPNNKHGDVCPNGVPALAENDDNSE